MIIKVCGLRETENIREISAIEGVSLVGMIFYNKSPRYVTENKTTADLNYLKNVGKVGVFVNESPDVIAGIQQLFGLDYIQLHGNETPGYLAGLKQKLPHRIKFIRAFQVGSEKDLYTVADFEDLCEYFLFDTPSKAYGGSGLSFNWQILSSYTGTTPFLLSGGIGPGSIDQLRDFRHPLFAGVDLNSRFEVSPAVKDAAMVRKFVQQLNSFVR